jgi:hypothetical protein
MSQWGVLSAVINLRRLAKDVVDLSDLVVYGTPLEREVALRLLPSKIRAMQFRSARLLTALDGDQ